MRNYANESSGAPRGIRDQRRGLHGWNLRLGTSGFHIYHAHMAFVFRAECGGLGAGFHFTNCLLIPTRETPAGTAPASSQEAVFHPPLHSVADRNCTG